MDSPLLVLLVVVPLVAGTVVAGLGLARRGGGRFLGTMTMLAHLTIVGALAVAVVTEGRLTYAIGGYAPPLGIQFVGDGLSVTLAALTSLVVLGVFGYALDEPRRSNHFYGFLLFLVGGVSGIAVTGDLFSMYVFFEITGIAAYTLISTGDSDGAAYAAFEYLIMGTFGAALFLLGVGYAYVATGTLTMADLAVRLPMAGYSSPLVLASAAFIVAGIAVKVPLVPVHTWLPGAHSQAPPGISAVVSAVVTAAAATALLRVLYAVFTLDFLDAAPMLTDAILILAAITLLAGSTLAIRQPTVKRMLAYSTVAQFGLVLLGIGLANRAGLTGAILHLAGHAIMKGGLFLCVGLFATHLHAKTPEEYAGLARRAPFASGAFAVLGLAMVGIPPGVGFFGKWYVALGAVQAGVWPVVAAVGASTLLTLAYFARLLERMYLHDPQESATEHGTVAHDGGTAESLPSISLAVVGVAAVLSVVFGLASGQLVELLGPTLDSLLQL